MRTIFLAFIVIALLGFVIKISDKSQDMRSLPTQTGDVASLIHLAPQEKEPDELYFLVARVIDGDTIVVLQNGKEEKVRLIGVDTPESADPRRTVECFGKEASDFSHTLLLNKEVRLESDPSQGDRDRYGRLLRFVFLPDESMANQRIIRAGYGHEYTYRTPYRHQGIFKTAEQQARKENRGLWAKEACGTISHTTPN